ncbi:MAG: efflux RND transporter periplasmic adaptor subunit, partial [Gammaproteobacteria bacterium]
VKQGDELFSILSTSSIGEIVISAPFNGFVGITDFKIGDELKNGDVLLTLDDMVTMKAYLYLPEKILPQLREPIKYTAYSKLFPKEKYTGVIANVNQRVDTETRTIKSYALIDNKNGALKPGLLLNIDIILEEIPDAILVPEQSILTAEDYSYVFVVEEDISKLKKITLGINNKGMTQILSGINEGDLVVTLGQEKLKDGSKIKLISE